MNGERYWLAIRNGCWITSRARPGALPLPPGNTGPRMIRCWNPACSGRYDLLSMPELRRNRGAAKIGSQRVGQDVRNMCALTLFGTLYTLVSALGAEMPV